jgi:hypothetical protein
VPEESPTDTSCLSSGLMDSQDGFSLEAESNAGSQKKKRVNTVSVCFF